MTPRRSARQWADPTCASCPSSPPNSYRCKRFIGFALAWLLIASGWSIRSAVFSGSTALSLQRTSAICGGADEIVGDDEDHALHDLVRSLMGELPGRTDRTGRADCGLRPEDSRALSQRDLGKVEGIGPVTTALVAAVGDRSSFKNGRQFAAWLGLVPGAAIERWPRRASSASNGEIAMHTLLNPRRSLCAWASSRQAGSKKPVARSLSE